MIVARYVTTIMLAKMHSVDPNAYIEETKMHSVDMNACIEETKRIKKIIT